MPNVKRGFDGCIYFNSNTWTNPFWNLVKAVRDIQVGADMEKTDASTRAGLGTKEYEPTLLDLSVAGKIRSNEADTTGFLVMESAFFSRSAIDVMYLDGPIGTIGSRGYRYDCKCFKLGEDQNIEGVLFREFELAPCVSDNPKMSVQITTPGAADAITAQANWAAIAAAIGTGAIAGAQLVSTGLPGGQHFLYRPFWAREGLR